MTTIFNYLDCVFQKNEVDTYDFSPYIFNRFVSFINFKYLLFADMTNSKVFRLPKDFMFKYYNVIISKGKTPFINYVKSDKEQELEYSFLFEKIIKYYNMSDKDFQHSKKIYLTLFNDKKVLRSYFEFFGVEEKYWKKYGFKIKQNKIVIKVKNEWF